jgi:hypothetical protein
MPSQLAQQIEHLAAAKPQQLTSLNHSDPAAIQIAPNIEPRKLPSAYLLTSVEV